jgi:hypothetical protein
VVVRLADPRSFKGTVVLVGATVLFEGDPAHELLQAVVRLELEFASVDVHIDDVKVAFGRARLGLEHRGGFECAGEDSVLGVLDSSGVAVTSWSDFVVVVHHWNEVDIHVETALDVLAASSVDRNVKLICGRLDTSDMGPWVDPRGTLELNSSGVEAIEWRVVPGDVGPLHRGTLCALEEVHLKTISGAAELLDISKVV